MKIAFFVQYCHEAGTYFRWHNLAKALVLNGHSVHVYAGDFNYKAAKRTENRDGVEYRITPSLISSRFFGNPSDPVTAIYRCFAKVDKGYDVYHLFQPFLQAYMPWQWLKYFRKGFFVYDWDDLWTGGIFQKPQSFRDRYTMWLVNYLEKKLPQSARATSVCSRYLHGLLPKSSNGSIFYNGFWPEFNTDLVARENIFIKEVDIFYLGYIGKTAAELDWIVDAARNIQYKYKQVHFLIVGPARSQIESSGLLELPNMTYLEQVSPEEAKSIACKLDVGLLPLENNAFNKSRFPIKFFDYLIVGTPVYYSGVGELKFIGGTLNYVYDGGSTKDEWIKNLEYFLDKNSYAPKPCIDVKAFEEVYSWPAIASKLAEFYGKHNTIN